MEKTVVSLPNPVIRDGRVWNLYGVAYGPEDGLSHLFIYATSYAHAQEVLHLIRNSGRIVGKMGEQVEMEPANA